MSVEPTDGKEFAAGEDPGRARFGAFELDLGTLELFRAGRPVRLQNQPARLLALLVGRPGQIVSREEIRQALWDGETFVDFEQGINHVIRQVRAALKDDAEAPRYLETLPRQGYRFVAPVTTAARPRISEQNHPVPAADRRRWRLWSARASGILLAAVILAELLSWVSSPAPPRPVLAVLPFEEIGQDPPTGLGDALTEELIGHIGVSYGGRLGVIARTSAMTYRKSGKDVRRIGRELGASHVLEGSVQSAGPMVRVAVRLVQSADQIPLWSSRYERERNDLLSVQSDIAARIAKALAINLLPRTDTSFAAPRTGPRSYDLYLEGRARLAAGDPAAAVDSLERCLTLDPAFAPAYLTLASARAARRWPPGNKGLSAREAVERALALDDGLVGAHVMLGGMLFYHDLDVRGARKEYEQALRINPVSAEAQHGLAWTYSVEGRHDEAIDAMLRALAHDPVDPMVASDVGWHFYWARRFDEAIDYSRRTLAVTPGFPWANRCILLASLMKGDLEQAARQAAAEMRKTDTGPAILASLDTTEPKKILDAYWTWTIERASQSPSDLAMIHLARGETDLALDAFEQAYQRRAGWILPFLPVEPLADPLRKHPRFQTLLARITSPR